MRPSQASTSAFPDKDPGLSIKFEQVYIVSRQRSFKFIQFQICYSGFTYAAVLYTAHGKLLCTYTYSCEPMSPSHAPPLAPLTQYSSDRQHFNLHDSVLLINVCCAFVHLNIINYIYLLLARCSRTFISNAVLPSFCECVLISKFEKICTRSYYGMIMCYNAVEVDGCCS